MSRVVSVALVQVGTEPYEVDLNRKLITKMAEEAFSRGANVVILPEMAIPGYVVDAEAVAEVAEPLAGDTVDAWRELAAGHHGLVCGGFCERENGKLYNTAVLVGAEGVLLHYRKLHLFNEEKNAFAPGDLGLPIVDTPFGRIGVCVCYDLRFVEVVRSLALRGAELICVPTAWLLGFDDQRWDDRGMCPQGYAALVQANLNQTFIGCASQVGTYLDNEFLGASLLVDPFGRVVAGPLSATEPEIAVLEVDIDASRDALQRAGLISPRADRRTDVYGIKIAGEVL